MSVVAPVTVALLLFEWLNHHPAIRLYDRIRHASRWQGPAAAALSAIPGCAGGMAITQLFLRNLVSSSALVAAHIGTSGDAAFVLLVGKPAVAIPSFLLLAVLGSLAGILAGPWVGGVGPKSHVLLAAAKDEEATPPLVARVAWAWSLLLAIGTLLTALRALGHTRLMLPAAAVAVLFLLLAAAIVADRIAAGHGLFADMIHDVSEIALWVTLADLAAVYAEQHWQGALQLVTAQHLWVGVALAALIGAIPGCGPQIALTRLFTAGLLPFPVLLANLVSQHGDAIFPLLRTRPRVAWRLTAIGTASGLVAGLAWVLVAGLAIF